MSEYNEPDIVTPEEIAEENERFESVSQARQALLELEQRDIVDRVDDDHWRVKSRMRCLGYIVEGRIRHAIQRIQLWLADRLNQE